MTVSMSAVWDRTSEFLSEHLTAIAGIAAVTMFVPAVISEVLSPLKADGGPGIMLGLGVLAIVFTILSLWGQLAIVALALEPAAGMADARSRATRRLGPAILVMLALLLMAFLLVSPVLAVLIANGVDLSKLGQSGTLLVMSAGAIALTGLYILILVPVVLWLVARIAVLPTSVVVAENLALGALGRSFRLTRGLALRIIGVLLLYGIVMGIASMAAETVLGSAFRLVLGGDGWITPASVLTALFVGLVATIFSVIGTAFSAKLYLAARARESAATA